MRYDVTTHPAPVRPPSLHAPLHARIPAHHTTHASLPSCSSSYNMSIGILVGLILLAMPWAITSLSNSLGRARKENIKFRELFK
jgi:hypothetical protein